MMKNIVTALAVLIILLAGVSCKSTQDKGGDGGSTATNEQFIEADKNDGNETNEGGGSNSVESLVVGEKKIGGNTSPESDKDKDDNLRPGKNEAGPKVIEGDSNGMPAPIPDETGDGSDESEGVLSQRELLMKEIASSGYSQKILLHENPKRKEKADYRCMINGRDMQTTCSYEVLEAGGSYTITFKVNSLINPDINDLVFIITADEQGELSDAYIADLLNPSDTARLKIAERGDPNYIGRYKGKEEGFEGYSFITNDGGTLKALVPAGEFEVEALEAELGSGERVLYFVNDNIPFKAAAWVLKSSGLETVFLLERFNSKKM